jgi:hypothetical protein
MSRCDVPCAFDGEFLVFGGAFGRGRGGGLRGRGRGRRHDAVLEAADGVRVLGLEQGDYGVGRRLLGDLEFPGARSPARRHIVLV